MFSVFELIGIYSEINQQVIENRNGRVTSNFKKITKVLFNIKNSLESVKFNQIEKKGKRFESIWNFYRKDLFDEEEIELSKIHHELPKIIWDESTNEKF